MKLIELKVKRKSLAAEARIIRKEERKQLGWGRHCNRTQNLPDAAQAYGCYNDLRDHRVKDVREHARYAHLAHAYLTGKAYRSVEQSTRPNKRLDPSRLAKEIHTFAPYVLPKVNDSGAKVHDWKTVIKWLEADATEQVTEQVA